MMFPLVIANIIAPVLIELAPFITQAIQPDGTLVLSGILKEQVALVKEAYSSVKPDLTWQREANEGEWHILVATMPRL